MSTRANIIITDGYEELFFYRHSDGYPEGVTPTLNKFLNMVKDGTIRDNIIQASGHLILLGHEEYKEQGLLESNYMRWKVGAYEPTTGIHGDVEFIYTIDLQQATLTIKRV